MIPMLKMATMLILLRDIRRRSVQAIGAGLNRRDWNATEIAYYELRDRLDDLIRLMEKNSETRNTTTQSDR